MVKEMQVVESGEGKLPMTTKCEIIHHTVVKKPKSVPSKATGRWASTPVKPDRQKQVDFILPSVSATLYDTGLLRILIFDSEGRSRAIQLTNTHELNASGHLQKFLEIIQEVTETAKIDFTNFRNGTVEYNDAPFGETFRAVIDASDLSSASKFAAIWSMLVSAPTLEPKDVLEIARHQKNPIAEDGIIYIGYMRDFILPYYDPVTKQPRWPQPGVQLTNENIRSVFLITSFLMSDSDKTLGEFSEMIGENFIAAAMNCPRETAESSIQIYNAWGIEAIKDLNLVLLKRVSTIPIHEASASLRKLLLERILAGETMTIEFYKDLPSYLASYLTVEEYDDFYSQLSNTSLSDKLPEEMGALALEVIVFYYLKSGFSKVLELLELIRSNPDYNSPFFYTRTVYEMQTPVKQKLKVPHFMLLLNDEYGDMPLGWAIPLIVAEIEADKQEHAKKIAELTASGALQIAA